MSGMAGGSARSSIVVELECLHAIAELLLLCEGSIALRLDLSFALAVGRLGLLEDIDNVLALCRHSLVDGHVNVHTGGVLTLLTTLPDLLMTVMVSPTPMTSNYERVRHAACNVSCNVGLRCGEVLDYGCGP